LPEEIISQLIIKRLPKKKYEKMLSYQAPFTKKDHFRLILPVLLVDIRQRYRFYEKILEGFSLFAKVDLQLARSTVSTYRSSLNIFFSRIRKPITKDSIRIFLNDYIEEYPNKSTYSTMLKALKCFFKKYLKSDITDSFRFPKIPYSPKRVPSKEQLQEFYHVLLVVD
jgi:hypothetical protein